MIHARSHFLRVIIFFAALLAHCLTTIQARPFENGQFQGRIAYSADGNHNDPDDWSASPVALAIFAEAGLRDRLVHFDYNSILPLTNPEWEKIHANSVLGGARQYGYDLSRFFDDRRDLEGSIANLVKAINTSSADDPLYLIIAGPMEVPYRAMQQCDRAKLKYVYCISHSRWNDGYQSGYKFSFTKRSVIEQDVHWVQIQDQNRRLSLSRYGTPAKPEEFAAYFWMRDSRDPKVKFLWEQMLVSTRPDPSDAGMAWFLATGDEECTPEKLKKLLEDREPVARTTVRTSVRIEAENFRQLDGLAVDETNDRTASHRLSVRLANSDRGSLRTRFDQPYAKTAGRYDIEIRYMDRKSGTEQFALFVNGSPCGTAWSPVSQGTGWTSHLIRDIEVKLGDELRLDLRGKGARVDFVQLNPPGTSPTPSAPMTSAKASAPAKRSSPVSTDRSTSTSKLDDPNAMPGGLIVAGKDPGYLKYNGGSAVFLSGPDNPEEFLYLGTLNADGTRSGGGQSEMIARMAQAGVNAFHCLVFRMQRCNFKREGDDTHSPFLDHDPTKPLNPAVLDQWDGWLAEFERAGINVHFELYNDATDVEMLGWKLDPSGNLHRDEERFIRGIVERFKSRKNILWGIEESLNKLPRARTAHFKKIGALIAEVDNYNHPIVASFVVPNDPEGDFPKDGVTTDDYVGDPNIRVITWLHVVPHGTDYEKQHQEYLRYARMDRHRFVAMKNETFRHPRPREQSRRYMWSCAMAGLHTLEAYHHAGGPKPTAEATLRDDAQIRRFMEQTDFHRMQSHDELAAGATKWVLANEGESYIAFSYAAIAPIGLKNLPAGSYDLLWFDPEAGTQIAQKNLATKGGEVTWPKPSSIGNEVALYVQRAGRSNAAAQTLTHE